VGPRATSTYRTAIWRQALPSTFSGLNPCAQAMRPGARKTFTRQIRTARRKFLALWHDESPPSGPWDSARQESRSASSRPASASLTESCTARLHAEGAHICPVGQPPAHGIPIHLRGVRPAYFSAALPNCAISRSRRRHYPMQGRHFKGILQASLQNANAADCSHPGFRRSFSSMQADSGNS